MKAEIAKLFPEIEQINDQSLKDQVAATWEEAIRKGGWRVEELKTVPFTLLISECEIDLITHTRAVLHTALKIVRVLSEFYGDRIQINRDFLIAGAILHDVGKLLEYTRDQDKVVKGRTGKLLRHPFSGSALAYKQGLPEEVVHMIATHAREGDGGYRSVEAMIIHYADFINFESLGGKM